MKSLIAKAAFAMSVLALSTSASAVSLFGSDIYIDTGDRVFGDDPNCGSCLNDDDSMTGIFDEFGFSQFLATSVYDLSDGDLLGSFFDTNDVTTLTGLGIPANGTALDGVTPVSLTLPTPGQVDIDALSPLVPPIANTDNEGFLNSWDMVATYTLNGTLEATGPKYTGGTIDIYFRNFLTNTQELVLTLTLTGSNLQAANLLLNFDVTFAKVGFLWVDDGSGTFIDMASAIGTRPAQAQLDTNVNPPFPDDSQLLLLGTNAIRQTTLDGSIGYRVPVPGTMLLLGLGLLGMASARKRAN
jgi:hypothetical protein